MTKGNILVAEDDETDAFFLQKALAETCPALRIIIVTDGQNAVEYLEGAGAYADRKEHPLPDHIFLDIKMPRRSGLEVLSWMRGVPGIRDIPVTVLSGSQIAADMELARGLGAEYIVKPVEFAALLEIARDFCRRF